MSEKETLSEQVAPTKKNEKKRQKSPSHLFQEKSSSRSRRPRKKSRESSSLRNQPSPNSSLAKVYINYPAFKEDELEFKGRPSTEVKENPKSKRKLEVGMNQARRGSEVGESRSNLAHSDMLELDTLSHYELLSL